MEPKILKISLVDFYSLSDEEKEEASDNGPSGKEWAKYLRIELDGETIALVSDAMEPEDVTFCRDLGWIPELLKKCYEIGLAENLASRK